MTESESLRRFIRSAFGSIWSLELLLALREQPERFWTREELIRSLRASDEVLSRTTGELAAVELIHVDEEGRARYAPGSPDMEQTVSEVAALYALRPGTVRRWIFGGEPDPVERFADAFRFRRSRGE